MGTQISVVIPTYNSSVTIKATLDSVLNQTVYPDEILVLDDGSSDHTISILRSFGSRLKIIEQKNKGVASARNTLSQMARGDLIAFLDHDDLWHPHYLETQQLLFSKHHCAVAYFTGHIDFYGEQDYKWDYSGRDTSDSFEFINAIDFMHRYTYQTGLFASMSFCCIPKAVLMSIGKEPFCTEVSGADDFYLFNLLPLFGPVIYTPVPLVAYRITNHAQSHDRLKSVGLAVSAFEHLKRHYVPESKSELGKLFGRAFAIKRRYYAKILMGAGQQNEARRQAFLSLTNSLNPLSIAKSLGMLALIALPQILQPKWPSSSR